MLKVPPGIEENIKSGHTQNWVKQFCQEFYCQKSPCKVSEKKYLVIKKLWNIKTDRQANLLITT